MIPLQVLLSAETDHHEVVESGLYAVIVCIRYVWYDEMYLVVFVLLLGTIVYADLWMRSDNYKEKTEVIQ